MTWTLGIFGGTTSFERNKLLKDGSACLIKDDAIVFAISEERLSRKRHDGGYYRSIKYCIDSAGIALDDIDLFVFSNCCDMPLQRHHSNGLGVDSKKVFNVSSHHLSHAYLAYKMSGLDSGIVIVMDNEGNIIGDKEDHEYYWRNKLERNSYYRFDNKLALISRDCLEPGEIGVGDTYHYFTHFLGWHSYTKAGRVMGLSGYGERDVFSGVKVFNVDDHGNIRSNLRNNRKDKELEVMKLGLNFGIDFGYPRQDDEEINVRHKNIAALIQKSLEDVLKEKISSLITSNSAKNNVCLSGGVAYNSLANRTLYDLNAVDKVFVPYCPGDEGQSIGNAVWGTCEVIGNEIDTSIRSPYLGRYYTHDKILDALNQYNDYILWERRPDFIKLTADKLAQGKIIAWFQGRSEFGNRALGNRSILADPRKSNMHKTINKLKGREDFRPVSPSILYDHLQEYFDLSIESPYMNQVGFANDYTKTTVPGVVHVDGSSRLQTVKKQDNEKYFMLINEFYKITGVPLIANTSFNYNGEPIVETPNDAIRCFIFMELELLIIEEYVIRKRRR